MFSTIFFFFWKGSFLLLCSITNILFALFKSFELSEAVTWLDIAKLPLIAFSRVQFCVYSKTE